MLQTLSPNDVLDNITKTTIFLSLFIVFRCILCVMYIEMSHVFRYLSLSSGRLKTACGQRSRREKVEMAINTTHLFQASNGGGQKRAVLNEEKILFFSFSGQVV